MIKTDDFELTFPAKPKIDEQDIVTEAGDTHLKMYQVMHNGAMILFTNATYPEGLDVSTDKEVMKKSDEKFQDRKHFQFCRSNGSESHFSF